jgi:predicted transcriptional regulator
MGVRDIKQNVLALVNKKPGLLTNEIAAATGISKSTVSATLSALTGAKTIKRSSDYTDLGRQSFRYYPKNHKEGKVDTPKPKPHRNGKMFASINLQLKSGPMVLTLPEARQLQGFLKQLLGG